MGISTQLTSRAAVQDPSPGNAAISGFQCRQTQSRLSFAGLLRSLSPRDSRSHPVGHWNESLQEVEYLQFKFGDLSSNPQSPQKVGYCSVHLYPQCFYGGLGSGDKRLLGSSGTNRRLCLKVNRKREEMAGLFSDIHKVTWPVGFTQLLWHSGISSHSWSASVSLLLPPTSFKTKPQTKKNAFPFRDQKFRSKHRFTLWSVNITVFLKY